MVRSMQGLPGKCGAVNFVPAVEVKVKAVLQATVEGVYCKISE
jgi:hypothetical protein